MVVALCTNLSCASCVEHTYGRGFFLFFSPYRRRAIFWEVGVPLSGFRSIVFRSACFASPVAENAPTDVALARAACRHRTGLSLPVPVAHATYIQMPAPAVVRGVFYTSHTREVFSRWKHTRQLVSLNTAAMIKLGKSNPLSQNIFVFNIEKGYKVSSIVFVYHF